MAKRRQGNRITNATTILGICIWCKKLYWTKVHTFFGENADDSLAMVEMKILLASIYLKYKTVPGEGCTPESMAFDDQITSAVPYAQRCMLEFTRR